MRYLIPSYGLPPILIREGNLPAPVADDFNGVAALFEEKLATSNIHPVIACRQDHVAAGATIQNNGCGLLSIGPSIAESDIVKSRRVTVDGEGDLVSCLLKAADISSA